jgi:hypothetical protein
MGLPDAEAINSTSMAEQAYLYFFGTIEYAQSNKQRRGEKPPKKPETKKANQKIGLFR